MQQKRGGGRVGENLKRGGVSNIRSFFQLRFSSIEMNQFKCPSPQCLVDQIQGQKPIILVVATDLMPDHI